MSPFALQEEPFISVATTKTEKERIAKQTGIKDFPAMRRVGALDHARSMPWEWFHLLLKNIIPNLVDFWTGQFKGLGPGIEDFEIAPHVWEEVGKETAAAVQHIPVSFVRVLSNIGSDCSLFTAEHWCFWFIYLAPKLLDGRFPKAKYYKHMCELIEVMKITLQFRMTLEQLNEVEQRLIGWVKKYEKYVTHTLEYEHVILKGTGYYYQYRGERLPACTLTVHGLLHVAQGIRHCGPIWTTWTFYMERFCGMLQHDIRSRARPWSNLNKSLLHMVYLEQLAVRYNLSDELARVDDRTDDGPIGYERILDGYPNHILRPPYKNESSGFGMAVTPFEKANYSQYKVVFGMHNGVITQVSYGDLERIFILTIPTDDFFARLSGQTVALALVVPWDTDGKDATKGNVYMTSRKASVITDIRNLQAVVGLVETRKKWGVIDRAPGAVAAVFASEDLGEETQESVPGLPRRQGEKLDFMQGVYEVFLTCTAFALKFGTMVNFPMAGLQEEGFGSFLEKR
ncbi:hypothetical protein BS17DRAFT_767596 [Gyrodon lividus]|nr:hypothetical protein BS17DRAFT_767596 [Gyrodon lividus]